MVEFNAGHKDETPRVTSNYQDTKIDWYNEKGEWGEVDIRDIETSDLWALRNQIERYLHDQLRVIDAELNNWTTIYCAICGEEDLAHRGYPFVTWGIRGGYVLCPRHLMRFDLMGTPEGELLKKAKEEEREIKELFG